MDLTVARSLQEAQERLDAPDHRYDLALADLRLPDGSGLALLAAIRQRGMSLPVMILSGMGEEEVAVAALKAGADDYVIKRKGYLDRLPAKLTETLARYRAEAERRAAPLRLLDAERHPDDIELTRRHLDRYAPHIALKAVASGVDLEAQLSREAAYDVLLLDPRLEGQNALEILKNVRSGWRWPAAAGAGFFPQGHREHHRGETGGPPPPCRLSGR